MMLVIFIQICVVGTIALGIAAIAIIDILRSKPMRTKIEEPRRILDL